MGFHMMDWIVIAVVGLLVFGPKALQGMARSAGRGMGQAKEMKDKLLSELPMDELMRMSEQFPKVPMNSQQALHMLISTDTSGKSKEAGESSVGEKHEIVESTLVKVEPVESVEPAVSSEEK